VWIQISRDFHQRELFVIKLKLIATITNIDMLFIVGYIFYDKQLRQRNCICAIKNVINQRNSNSVREFFLVFAHF
jgi:hypothetical protein